jgi:hypothetical protein
MLWRLCSTHVLTKNSADPQARQCDSHLQSKTTSHWVTWLGTTVALGIVAFVVAEAVPF